MENKGGAAKLEVTKFYSERMFCGPEKRNCLARVRECKNAQLTYSVENNDQELFTAICSTIFGRSTKDVGSWMKLRDMKPIDTTS
ncbi:hypothetical protein ASJ81_04390 [Methanosarcina spelaei]|uniref:Uncharacterized protein n=1 Tax=Methanosarcina spelaei TaxID=1036679 RepID=A0A2A2HUK8_9EURY|nr:hypothetical protein ASJ81_04390 [Methanosarcina spelaei]